MSERLSIAVMDVIDVQHEGGLDQHRGTLMKLTNIACKNAKPAPKVRRLSDGKGLYLEIAPSGSKYWRMKFRFLGKEKRLAFGVYPEVSLLEAREKRDQARKLLANDEDPSEIKKQRKLILRLNHENTFEALAREWHTNRRSQWSEKHALHLLNRLETDIFPKIGSRPIKALTAPEILLVIRAIEKRGALDVAKRMLQVCSQVFLYTERTGRIDRNPCVALKGALKSMKTKHHAHLSEDELPEFFQKLEQCNAHRTTKLAFRLVIHTFVRSAELRHARWEEIDFQKAEWRIPAERMKMKEQHLVPLTPQTLKILGELRTLTGFREHLFPSVQHPRKCMSENTLLFKLYGMGYKDRATVHGFRSTASTVLNENGFSGDVIERQLAHCERNQIRSAYNHAQFLSERRKMMEWWSAFLDQIAIAPINDERVSSCTSKS